MSAIVLNVGEFVIAIIFTAMVCGGISMLLYNIIYSAVKKAIKDAKKEDVE
jgi:hypothetical protein